MKHNVKLRAIYEVRQLQNKKKKSKPTKQNQKELIIQLRYNASPRTNVDKLIMNTFRLEISYLNVSLLMGQLGPKPQLILRYS